MIRQLIIILTIFSFFILLKTAYTQNVGINSVTIRFVQPPATATVEIAPLRYNKDFAFGMHLDDGKKDIYTHAYPLLNGGVVSGVTYPGLYFTDGCGNDIAFKMSSSIFSFEQGGNVDGHDPNGPYANVNVTWPELTEMYQDGWSVYNHGLTSSNSLDPYYSIRRNHSYIKRMMLDATSGGPEMKVFVNPNGDETFTTPAFEQDYITAYRQYAFGVPSFDVTQYTFGDTLKMGRTSLEGGVSLAALVDNMAAASVGGAHHFGATFSHSVTGGFGYSFPVFRAYMNYIESNYGKNGQDNVWMTTEEEILEYLMLNEDITLNTQLIGTDLIISFSGTLRTDFRFYASSLVVNGDQSIDTIFIDGGTNNTFNGLGTNTSLINLEWDGYVEVPDTVNAEYYVSIAEATQQQTDWNIAMDYVEIVPAGPTKEAFRDRLCVIPGITPPTGYCFCTTDLGPDTTICIGDCVTLTAEAGGASYYWSTGDSTQSITVCPPDTTTYYVTVYNDVGCPAEDSITVNVAPLPIPDAGKDTTLCSGYCMDLTATGGARYIWSTGDTTQTITVCPVDTTTYYVTVYSPEDCTAEDSVTVFVIDSPTAFAGNDTTICIDDCVELTATGGGTYLWSTGDTTDTIVVCPQDTTSYIVTVTAENACEDSDTLTVFVNPLPIPEAGNDTTICEGDPATLTAGGGVSYEWSTGDTSQSINVYPEDTTLYYVTVTNEYGCSAEDSVTVNVLPAPEITVGNDTTICIGECAALEVIGIGDILWSTGDTTAIIVVCPPVTTTYYVTVTNEMGCNGIDSVTVYVNPLPIADAGPDTTICRGDWITLNASGGVYYYWSTGDSTFYTWVSPPETTTYYVAVFDSIGCYSIDSVTVTVNYGPELSLSPDTSICYGECVILSASGAENYLWSTGDTIPLVLVCPGETTIYTVTGSVNWNECSTTDTVTVFVNPNPIAEAGNDTTYCLGYSVTLNATGGVLYIWNGTDTSQSITVSPPDTTMYYVEVFNAEGCSSEDSVKVTPLQTPEVGFWGLDPAYCENEPPAIMYGYPGGGYFEGDGVAGNIFDPSLAGEGIHPVSYNFFEPATGCTGSDTVFVHVSSSPSVYIGPDTNLCNNAYIDLDAGPGYDSYLWSNGSLGQNTSIYGEDLGIGVQIISIIVTKDGCTGFGQRFVNVEVCNPGISEHGEVPFIEIYPNPSDGIFTLSIEGHQGVINLDILDTKGINKFSTEIHTSVSYPSDEKINLQNLPNGVYILRLSNDRFVYSSMIVVQ